MIFLLQRIGGAVPPRLGGMSLNGNVLQSPRRDAPYAPNGESIQPYLIFMYFLWSFSCSEVLVMATLFK